MESMTRVQNLDEAVYISHRANTFEKVVYPTILALAMDK